MQRSLEVSWEDRCRRVSQKVGSREQPDGQGCGEGVGGVSEL